MAAQHIKAFQLLDFVTGNKNRKKPLMIECVPSQWISFNPSIGKCQCKFMPPPYSEEDTELVDTLVKQQGHPPESWPTYTVNLRGHATTYDDAMKRLEILKVKPYAYTEDGILPEKKATNVTKAYQRLKIKGDQALAKELMQVPELVSSTSQHSSRSEDSPNETSDVSIDENENNKNKLKKKKAPKHITDTESTDENYNILRRSTNNPKHKSKNTESSKRSLSAKDCARADSILSHERGSQLLSEPHAGNQKDTVTPLSNRRQVDVTEKPKKSHTSQSSDSILSHEKGSQLLSEPHAGNQKDTVTPLSNRRQVDVTEKPKKSHTSQSSDSILSHEKGSQLLSEPHAGNQKDTVTPLSNRRQVDVTEKPKKSHTSQSFAHSSKESSRSRAPEKNYDQMGQVGTLTGLRFDIQALTEAFKELKGVIERSALAQNAFGTNVQSFSTEFNVVFPMTTMEDFHTFDDRLKMDTKLRKEFTSTLHFIVDSHTTLARNITAMLKKHISRDVALKFNAVKTGKDKEIFKETKLCNLLRDNGAGRKALLPARYLMAIMGSIGLAIVYGFKVNVSIAIVAMVNHTAIKSAAGHTNTTVSASVCASGEQQDTNIASVDGPFEWSESVQGLILSSYFWGYILTQLPGGRVAELFSARWVMNGSIVLNAVASILSPWFAQLHYSLFIVMRITQGLGGGVTFPAMHVMIAKWAPPDERSILSSIVYAGTALGTVISIIVSGLLAGNLGWASVFYVEGALSLIWCVGWAFLVQDSPEQQTRFITQAEKDYIASSLGQDQDKTGTKKKKPPVPWGQVLRSLPFWAILISHLCSNFGWYMLLTELPTFMNQILKFSMNANAALSAMPFLCMWFFTMSLGKILAIIQSKGWISISISRKIGTIFASFVPMVCLIGVSYVGCNRALAVVLMTIGVTCIGGMFCGFLTNHIDIAPNFAGTLVAITNTVATIPGFIVPPFVGALTEGNQTIEAWRIIFFTTVGLYIIEIVAYTIFGTAEEQPWNRVETTDEESPDQSLPLREKNDE